MSFDDVMIAGTNAGANGKLADEISGKDKGRGKSKTVTHNHSYSGEITIKADGTEIGKLSSDWIRNSTEGRLAVMESFNKAKGESKNGKSTGKTTHDLYS